MIEHAISLPFTILPNGVIATTTDQSKLWADRVMSAIGTYPGERIQQPEFGSHVHEFLFGTVDAAKAGVTSAVEKAFIRFLPTLTLNSVNFSFDENENVLTFSVSYFLPNDDLNEIQVGTVTIDGNSPIKEF